MRNRSRFSRRTLAWASLGCVLVLFSGCMFPTPSSPPKVILYGDSIGVESRFYFDAVIRQNGIAEPIDRTQSATGICDFFDDMEADKESVLPTAVVLEFVGNPNPPCVGGLTGAALLEKYRQDAQHAIDIWKARGVKVYLVGPPRQVINGSTPETPDPYRDMYYTLALQNNEPFIDAGHSAVFNYLTGFYQFHMPCLPDETPELGCGANGLNGLIQVRDPDGLHFCTTHARPLPCAGYHSGARRFGFEMAAKVVTIQGW